MTEAEKITNWDLIQIANEGIKTINISRSIRDESGKYKKITNKYVEVKERVIAFRKVHPLGQIIPEISFTDNYIVCECVVLDENGKILSKGHARELGNKTFGLESCETSAIGRALGFCGYGISTSIASVEEMKKVDEEKVFDEIIVQKKDLVNEFTKLYSNIEQVNILNSFQTTDPYDLDTPILQKYINIKKYGNK